MTISAVVFDIGNVLIEWQPERFYDSVIGEERRRKLFSDVDLHVMNDKVDRGQEFRQTVYDHAETLPAWREEIRLWHDRWLDMAGPSIPHSIRLMSALQAQEVPVLALSNFGVETFDLAKEHYGFLEDFDQSFISGHMQVVKPESRIYEMLEEACGIPPEELLFTDDRAENIAMATKRGWQTHLFENPEGWAEKLIATGLLTQEQAA